MKKTGAWTLAVTLLGCQPADKATGPSGPVEAVSVSFCALRPSWMAVQNEGDVWKQVTIPASGPISFDATQKVSVAMNLNEFGSFTIILNLTRDEINGQGLDLFGCEIFGDGDRELSGTVAGLGAGEVGNVAILGDAAYSYGSNLDWNIMYLPNSAVDLVGVRYSADDIAEPNSVIVRRNISPQVPPSSPLPVLNFAGTEAAAPDVATVTVSGVGDEYADFTNTFMTVRGTSAQLTDASFVEDGSFNVYAVPAALRVATDVHRLDFVAEADDGLGIRGFTQWYQSVASSSVALGPPAGVPTVTQVATSPYLRMRAELASQTAYPSAAIMFFVQSGSVFSDFGFVVIMTSSGFVGSTPSVWDLTTPDLTGAGYLASWGLNPGQPVQWQLTVVDGAGTSVFGNPVVGSIVSSASRFSSQGGGFAVQSRSRPLLRGNTPWLKASTRSSSWSGRAQSPGTRRPPRR